MDQGNTGFASSGSPVSAPVFSAPDSVITLQPEGAGRRGSSGRLKKILIIAGVLVGLAGVGLAAWGIFSVVGRVDRQQAIGALNNSVEAVTFLDDRLSMIRGGGITVGDVFAEGVLETMTEYIDGLDSACGVLCGKPGIDGTNAEGNELFAVVRTGLEERNELYRRYYLDNFGVFYEAFASSFREIQTKDYVRTAAITTLMESSNATTTDLAKGLDEFLSGASGILTQMRAINCSIGGGYSGVCGELNVQLNTYTVYIQDSSLTQKMFFMGEDVSTKISEEFIGGSMLELAQMLELDGAGMGAAE